MTQVPYGYCHCGCGQKTTIPKKSAASRGIQAGVPIRFVKGHNRRSSPVDYKVDEATGCWLWQRSITRDGYGQRWCPERRMTMKAHRWYYLEHVGPIPEGMHIDHVCQTTTCVNPEHLEVVSALENLRRSRHSKLSMEIAREIRASPEEGVVLAKRYGVAASVISAIRTGRTWKEPLAAVSWMLAPESPHAATT
jgi:hypothetical protein